MKQALAILIVALAGCTTVNEPISVGNDTYMLGSRTYGGMKSWLEINAENHKRANEFCEKQGKTANITEKGTSGARGWTPMESDVTFQCVAK